MKTRPPKRGEHPTERCETCDGKGYMVVMQPGATGMDLAADDVVCDDCNGVGRCVLILESS